MKVSNPLKFAIAGLGILVLGMASTSASAAPSTVTTTFQVSATVQPTCSITATDLSFGTYSTGQLDGASTITVTCTNTTPYDIGLDAGTSPSATVTSRKMTSGSATLNYALFSNSGRSTNWGNTVSTDTVHSAGTGSGVTVNVYGRIAGGQYVTPGNFTDTITATVTY